MPAGGATRAQERSGEAPRVRATIEMAEARFAALMAE